MNKKVIIAVENGMVMEVFAPLDVEVTVIDLDNGDPLEAMEKAGVDTDKYINLVTDFRFTQNQAFRVWLNDVVNSEQPTLMRAYG